MTIDETKDFLEHLSVYPNNPHRENVSATNIRFLGQVTPQIPLGELEAIYEKCIDEIFRSMEGAPIGPRISELFNLNEYNSNNLPLDIQAKRFTKERLLEILGGVVEGSFPLLKRVTDTEKGRPTNLEAKLIAGGAEEKVIGDAKMLRANASFRLAEISSLSLFGEMNQIEDVGNRLITLSNSVIQKNTAVDFPARIAWDELLHRLESNPGNVDPNQLFRQDPFLLLGYVCELTDKCLITWGVPIA